jgi:uncharacterized membrane protein YtjA (UPF0391 family)
MWSWAAVFFIVPLVAIFFGFGGSPASTAEAAKIVFYLCLAFAALSLLAGRRSPA